MIQVNELRFGNWIKYLGDVVQVFGTRGIYVITIDEHNEREQQIAFPAFEPIPLTPEILEKAGFVLRQKDEDGIIYGKEKYTIIYTRCTPGGFGYFLNGYHNDVHLQYLHQLQNLYFALTGEELKINL